jgi:ectoine hydroxylase-related dioxygenase (phytanoyl-CoA dioxygenase family)
MQKELSKHSDEQVFFTESEISVDDLMQTCSQKTLKEAYPLAESVAENIIIYDAKNITHLVGNSNQEKRLKTELNHILGKGPGVFIIRNLYEDSVIDQSNGIFHKIIKNEATNKNDHFASGSNTRIWNSLQKVAIENSEAFISYYANNILRVVAESWCGPNSQMTAQVNIVKPGSGMQKPHRDYHLGFQENETVQKYPISSHLMSQHLTLQAVIAHSDMPLESGPTLLMPHSQKYELGYLAWRNKEFQSFFSENAVQLPLKKGDGVFCNPALFHAAGSNSTNNFNRIANLLQISSVFGKAMERIDYIKIIKNIYPALLEHQNNNTLSKRLIENVLVCATDGYAFPTNLDYDTSSYSSVHGLSMFEVTQQALQQSLDLENFTSKLYEHQKIKFAS